MKKNHHLKNKQSSGFTIVEVMIVLAIASLILLILFLIIPQVQRSKRDYARRHYVDFISAQYDSYKANYGRYPTDGVSGSPDNRCTFIQDYLRTNGTSTCTSDTTSYLGVSQNCIKADTELYTICFHARNSSHDYIGPEDEISIEPGHFCTDTNVSPDKYIKSTSATDDDTNKYVIWTKLENGSYYCVDNGLMH